MERAGLNRRPILLLVALLASLAASIPAGKWLGTPRPISGTVPVDSPKGPPLLLPAAAAMTRSEVRRMGAAQWREMPLEVGLKALAALAKNYGSLPPPGATCVLMENPDFEIRFSTSDGYSLRLAMSRDGQAILENESLSPDGSARRVNGVFALEGPSRWDVLDAVGPTLSEASIGSQK